MSQMSQIETIKTQEITPATEPPHSIVTGGTNKAVNRRTTMLQMEGYGYARKEIVDVVSEKFNVSRSLVYREFRNRAEWQPILQEYENLQYLIMNRWNTVYHASANLFKNTRNDPTKIACLKIMAYVNGKMGRTIGMYGSKLVVEKTKIEMIQNES